MITLLQPDLINVAFIGKLDHDLQLLHLDVQGIIVFAEEDLEIPQTKS